MQIAGISYQVNELFNVMSMSHFTIQKQLKKLWGSHQFDWSPPETYGPKNQWEEYFTTNKYGVRLAALFGHAKTFPAKGSVLLGHPFRNDAKNYFLKSHHVSVLRNNGYHTMLFDFNGFGASENGNMDYGEDIVAVGNLLAGVTPKLPIGYLGVSLGAGWGILGLTAEAHPFKVAVLDSPITSMSTFKYHFSTVHRLLLCLAKASSTVDLAMSPWQAIKQIKHLDSVLLLYGGKDTIAPSGLGQILKYNSSVEVTLKVFEEASHMKAIDHYPKAYELHLIRYLDLHLASRGRVFRSVS
ncbi:MAG: alpha/beta hydrolase [Cyclobacteriaceae bacterium]